jgi:LPXTG-site transpeptidase (sortase) family protein
LNIDLPLIPSNITEGKWETTDQGVSYLVSSPIPGEKGNSIMYAHNWASLFGNLPSILPGDLVQIQFSDGTAKEFEVKYTSTVTPDNYSILAPTDDKRITIYTCSGFLDSHRFVAVAILK